MEQGIKTFTDRFGNKGKIGSLVRIIEVDHFNYHHKETVTDVIVKVIAGENKRIMGQHFFSKNRLNIIEQAM